MNFLKFFFLLLTFFLFLSQLLSQLPSQDWIKPKLTLLMSTLSSSNSSSPKVNSKFRIKSVDVESGSTFHLHCKGNRPIAWKYPENIVDELSSMQNLVKIESNCLLVNCDNDHESISQLCTSNFTLFKATYEQTGAYTCYYNDSVDAANSLYIFVNNKDYLLVPYEGNPYFILVSVIQSHPAVIPCLPTNSRAKIELWKSHAEGGPVEIKVNNKTGISFDPTQGFYFSNPKWDIESSYLECRAKLDGLSEKLEINIHWSIDPVYGIKPFIDINEAIHVHINKSFSLNCLVHLELGVLITLFWDYPNHDSQRIIELDPITNKTGIKSYQKETISRKLIIKNAQVEDEGYYFCNVTDVKGRTYSTNTYITVYNQSFPSTVFFSMDLNKTHFVRKFKESLQLVVNVHAIPDLDSTSLIWFKDGQLLGNAKGQPKFQQDKLHYQMYLERNQAILRIEELEMKDTGIYVLVGNTTNMTSNITIVLQVEGLPKIDVSGTHRYYSIGQSYTITCVAIGIPRPKIRWELLNCHNKTCSLINPKVWLSIKSGLNNETLVENNITFSLQNHITSSSLKIVANQNVIYRCFGENPIGSSFREIEFEVTDAGEEGFFLNSSFIDVVETDHLSLTCKASVFEFTRITWYYSIDGRKNALIAINNVTNKVQILETKSFNTLTSVLQILNVHLNNSGVYFCNATQKNNQFEETNYKLKQKKVKVQKMEKPKIVKTNMKNELVEVWLTKMNEFYCYAKGKPKPIISWFKNGKIFNVTGLHGIDLVDDNQKLVIRRLVAYDSGKYQCQVKNKAGTINFYSTLKILGKNEEKLSIASILAIIMFLIIMLIIVFIAYLIGQKIRRDREKHIEFFAKNLFNRSQLSLINPNTPLDEQVDLLAYDQRWEFPNNRLKLIRTLGEGAFGRVVLAEAIGIGKNGTSELVAVKMLKANSNCSQKKALIAELKILIHLGRHLNIVNCLGAVTKNLEKGKLMVIVEYCCFGNLRQYLYDHRETFIDEVNLFTGEVDKSTSKTNCLILNIVNNPCYQNNINEPFNYINWSNPNLEDLKKLNNDELGYQKELENSKDNRVTTCDLICCAFQVARGMEYLEQKKLIHRDLAARNVLVAEKGVVKICDFGLAKNIQYEENYVNKGDGLLPVKWMAIESIGNQVFTTKSDVWSFGVLLWEIFTLGGNPYPGIEVNKQFYDLLKSGYRMEKPSLCPINMYEIMKKCWNVNPSNRPDFTQLAEKLGLMIEANVRNYYLELNNPYHEANKMLKENKNYLEMNKKSNLGKYQNVDSFDLKIEKKLDPMENYDLVTSIRPVNGVSSVSKVPMEIVPMINFENYDKQIEDRYLNMNSNCLPNYNLVSDNNYTKYPENFTCTV